MKTLADKLGEQEEKEELEVANKKKVEPLKVKKTDKVYGKKK